MEGYLEITLRGGLRGGIFFPALPGEYEALSVNYWNFDESATFLHNAP